MKTLEDIVKKDRLLVIGLMSGTSADGMDAALTEITGQGQGLRVRQLGFLTVPYSDEERREILRLAEGKEGGSRDLCLFSFWLGQRGLEACRRVCEKAGVDTNEIDLVGSHGQTLYHIPAAQPYLGAPVRGTLQLGEASVIAEGLQCPAVSDFRVRDLAAGGAGAPLVPYAEYLLYRSESVHVGLQNIGGIGNITVLPRACRPQDVFAFDTGPGNMVMDQLAGRMTDGRMRYDEGGRIAAKGRCSEELLAAIFRMDPYPAMRPPKTTGREHYGAGFADAVQREGRALGLSDEDILATATHYTAQCIALSVERWCEPGPEVLIVGGGGCANGTLMAALRQRLRIPVKTNEDIGFDSDAKEAVAFAILAAECVRGRCNNVPSVTGASHPVVMGKITL